MDAKACSRKMLCVLAIVAAASPGSAQGADKATRSQAETQARRQLIGVWRGFVVNGKGEDPTRGPVKLVLTVKEDQMQGTQIKGNQDVDHGKGSYELVLDSNPRQLDGYPLTARGKRAPWLGIYELQGDTLKWCVGKRQRPSTFETVKGQFLMILKADRD